MKRTILAFVGSSGCGKTMAVEMVKRMFNIPVVVSKTTRPMRDNEVNGVDHYFMNPFEYDRIDRNNPPLAYTYFGGCHYWVTWEDVCRLGSICSYVVDEDGLQDLLRAEYCNPDLLQVIPIRIHRKDELRAQVIPKERMARDEHRPDLRSSIYYAMIPNNRSVEEFQVLLAYLIDGILKDIYPPKTQE